MFYIGLHKQGSHKLLKYWKITEKKCCAWKNHGIWKNLNNHGKSWILWNNLIKPPVARKLAVRHMCPTASFLTTGGFKFDYFKIYAWSVYKHAVDAAFMFRVVKMLLKEEVGVNTLNQSLKLHCWSWKIMEKSQNCVFEFLWEPCIRETW